MSKNKNYMAYFGLFLGVLLLPHVTEAGPIIRSGDLVSVEANQVIEGDFYGAGGTVSISGEAKNDVYVAGGSVTVNAPVGEDLVVLGGTVQIHAAVHDDVRIMGGEATLAGPVSGDVFVFGGALHILSTAVIEGDVFFFGGDLDVNGTVRGSVNGKSETARIDAHVGKDVTITAGRTLALGDRAEILGRVEYTSPNELLRAQGAVVGGDIQQKSMENTDDAKGFLLILPLFILLFAALTLYVLLRPAVQHLTESTEKSYGMNGLIGLAVLLTLPFIALLLMFSVLGMFVGLFLFLFFILLSIASMVLAGITIGTLILKPLTKSNQVSLITVVVGAAVLSFLPLVPYIGPLCLFAAFVIGLGGLSRWVYEGVRS